MKVYHTEIEYKSILKKDNWRLGGHAHCFISNDPDFSFKMEVNQFGKTKEEAEMKIKKMIGEDSECISKDVELNNPSKS